MRIEPLRNRLAHPDRTGRRVLDLAGLFFSVGFVLATGFRLLLEGSWYPRRPRGRNIIAWWMRSACKLIGVEIDLHRRPCPPPVLMVANHISWLDIPAICAVSPGVFIAKAEVSRWPEDRIPQRA